MQCPLQALQKICYGKWLEELDGEQAAAAAGPSGSATSAASIPTTAAGAEGPTLNLTAAGAQPAAGAVDQSQQANPHQSPQQQAPAGSHTSTGGNTQAGSRS